MKNDEKSFIKKHGIVGSSKRTDIEKRREIIKEVLDNRDPDLTLQGLKDILRKNL